MAKKQSNELSKAREAHTTVNQDLVKELLKISSKEGKFDLYRVDTIDRLFERPLSEHEIDEKLTNGARAAYRVAVDAYQSGGPPRDTVISRVHQFVHLWNVQSARGRLRAYDRLRSQVDKLEGSAVPDLENVLKLAAQMSGRKSITPAELPAALKQADDAAFTAYQEAERELHAYQYEVEAQETKIEALASDLHETDDLYNRSVNGLNRLLKQRTALKEALRTVHKEVVAPQSARHSAASDALKGAVRNLYEKLTYAEVQIRNLYGENLDLMMDGAKAETDRDLKIPDAVNNLFVESKAARDRGDNQAAIGYLTAAKLLDAADARVRAQLSGHYIMAQRWKEAITEAQEALNLTQAKPADHEQTKKIANNNLHAAWLAKGNDTEAARYTFTPASAQLKVNAVRVN